MQSMQSTPARPMGPRIQRPASPAAPFALPEIAPLNIRNKGSNAASPPQNNSPAQLSALATPLGLYSGSMTPTTPLHTPGSSRPKLRLGGIALNPFGGGYAGGPNNQNGSASPAPSTDGSGDVTIMPAPTISPQTRPPPVVSMESLRRTVEEFDTWTDDMLEETARLGEGAGGAVYKVRDKRTGFIMARKTITTMEAPMKQLIREIKIISSTKHVNIIEFYGAYISPSSSEVKVVMEFCEGGSLESIGKQMRQIGGRVSEKVAGRLAEGILQGLAYLHSQKTIHRDIKPPNVLLTREGIVRLCDFGVSGELVNSNAGTFTGTSLYMAPERLSGLNYSIRSDVWSTGITLLELVQNRFPFPTDLADIELMMHITQNEPPELEDEEDEQIIYSPEMKEFIKLALTRDPNQRPIPKDLLDHPWIRNVMSHDVNMAAWIRKVWAWRKPDRKSGEGISRPGSSRSEDTSMESSMARLSVGS